MENIKLPELQTTKTELTTSTEENSVVEVEEKKIPFQIKLLENEVQTSSMPISWCVDPEWLDKTKKYYVLITVAPPTKSGKYKEWRTVAKLSDMVAYITFYSKGRNVIAARLTTSKTEAELWMSRDDGKWSCSGMKFQEPWEYEEDVYPGVDKKWERLYWAGKSAEDYIEVDMPEDCFAKEPSEFEKKWVNLFFKGKVIDECNFRKRRIFAYSIQPLVLFVLLSFLTAIISIVQISNILIGKWVVWEGIFSAKLNISKRIDFVHVKKFKYLNWIFVPIPAIAIISTALLLLTKIKLWLLLIPIYIILVPLIFLVILSSSYILPKLFKQCQILYKYFTQKTKTNYNNNINNSIQINKKDLEYISMISCYSPTIIKSIKDIPTKKKTIKLRFAKLKSSVCKSYSR